MYRRSRWAASLPSGSLKGSVEHRRHTVPKLGTVKYYKEHHQSRREFFMKIFRPKIFVSCRKSNLRFREKHFFNENHITAAARSRAAL